MRFAPRLAVPVAVFTFAAVLAGCGGQQVAFHQVPGDPVQLTVPGTAEAFAPTATPTPAATTDATGTDPTAAAPTPAAGTTDTSGQSTTDGTAGGGTTAPSTSDGTTNDQPPPAGSPAQQFEDYCASNPGAC